MDQTRGLEGVTRRSRWWILRSFDRAAHCTNWAGARSGARELGIARNRVRRDVRLGEVAEVQARSGARTLEPAQESNRAIRDGSRLPGT